MSVKAKGKRVKRWTGVMWAALNTSDQSYVNAPRGGLWQSLTRGYPLLSWTRSLFDLSSEYAKPVRVRVTITPLPPKPKGKGEGR